MTHEERLEHIWSSTHDDYRGYAGERWPLALRGRRTVLVYAGQSGTVLKLLDDLTEAEIAAKLPVQFRHLPATVAARPTSPPRPAAARPRTGRRISAPGPAPAHFINFRNAVPSVAARAGGRRRAPNWRTFPWRMTILS
ncbi:hypothetical protein GA0061099_10601, partial [Bradyrhizobium yuanmingense]